MDGEVEVTPPFSLSLLVSSTAHTRTITSPMPTLCGVEGRGYVRERERLLSALPSGGEEWDGNGWGGRGPGDATFSFLSRASSTHNHRLSLHTSMNKLSVGGLGGLLGGGSPARHPYAPSSLSLPGYAPVARSLSSVLIPFFGIAGAVTAGAWAWAGMREGGRGLS